MKDRSFTPLLSLLSLVSMICFLTACSSGGSSGSASSPAAALEKNAVVTVGVDPGAFSKKAKKISSSTTAIQLYITQWQVGDLNELTVMNTDTTHTLTAANAATTISLYPTYTRICASQYSGATSANTAPTEASCSFGLLNSGNNTVTLTMLTGTWTLSPVYNGVQSFALSYPPITAATTGSASYGVYDGNLANYTGASSGVSAPGQSINNWGSGYVAQVNNPVALTTYAAATSFFNNGDIGPSFGSGGETQSAPGTQNNVKTTIMIGGLGTGVGSNGLISETKNIIWYPLNSTTPVLVSPTETVEVQDKSGNNVTSAVLSNCQLQVLSGTSIQACGITSIKQNGQQTSSSDIQSGASNNYNYKVTSTSTATGADICYIDDAGAMTDSSGNIICYDYDYFTSGSVISCPLGGTYTNGTCQYSLSSICTNKWTSGQNSSGGIYDSSAQSCTVTSVGYLLKMNSTTLTLTDN